QIACAFLVEVAAGLVRGLSVSEALALVRTILGELIAERFAAEQTKFSQLLASPLESFADSDISGRGYVISCLEASLCRALQADSYSAGVLRAINLGDDTDTTGAVTGGLLGLRFGRQPIPREWIQQLARRDEILALCDRFQCVCQERWEADQ